MKHWIVSACIGMSLCLAGCGKPKPKQAPPAPKQEAPQETPQPDAAEPAAAAPAPLPDATVTVTSSGSDPLDMVNEALKSAITTANEQAGAAGSAPLDFGLQAARALRGEDKAGKSSMSPIRLVQDPAFAEQVVLLAKGLVAEFRVASASGPDKKGIYTISIEARIPRQPTRAAPADAAQK